MDFDEDDDEEDKKPKKLPSNLYLSWGNYYLHLHNYEKSMKSFNTVLTDEATNVKALKGACKSYLGQGKLKEAEETIHKILNLVPNDSDAKALKGDIDYLQGDFETGLVEQWAASVIRPNRIDLRLGHQICQKAIDNSLCPGGSLNLDEFDVSEIEDILQGFEARTGEPFMTKRCDPYSLDDDINFTLRLGRIEAIEKVHPICKELLLFLRQRKNLWQVQNPYRDRVPLKPKMPQWIKDGNFDKLDSFTVSKIIKVKCQDAQEAITEGDFDNSLETSLEALALLHYKTNYDVQETAKLRVRLMYQIGLSHMLKNDFVSAQVYFEKQFTLSTYYNLPDFKLKALFCLGKLFFKQNQFRKAIAYYNHSMRIPDSAAFEAIVLYKLSDCQMNLNNLQKGYDCAERAVSTAIVNNDVRLQLDATLLMAEISVKDQRIGEAEQLYLKAISLASQNNDPRQEDIQGIVLMFQENSNNLSKIERLSEKLESISIFTKTQLLKSKKSNHSI